MTGASRADDTNVDIGYIDVLLEMLCQSNPDAEAAFGRHVHWGYWERPESADGTGRDYAEAAEALTRKVCGAAAVGDGMKILDAGCGVGGTIASLNERFSNVELVGLNIDRRQLERAEQQVQPRAGNTIRWVEGDACRLPFEKDSFDAVLAVECIFHFPSRVTFFGEVKRVLRPGGRLGLSDFVPQSITLPLLRVLNWFSSADIRYAYGETDIFWTLPAYRRLARKSGLPLVEATDIAPNTLPTYEFLLALFEKCPPPFDKKRFLRATEALRHGARSGLVRYQILGFENSGPKDENRSPEE